MSLIKEPFNLSCNVAPRYKAVPSPVRSMIFPFNVGRKLPVLISDKEFVVLEFIDKTGSFAQKLKYSTTEGDYLLSSQDYTSIAKEFGIMIEDNNADIAYKDGYVYFGGKKANYSPSSLPFDMADITTPFVYPYLHTIKIMYNKKVFVYYDEESDTTTGGISYKASAFKNNANYGGIVCWRSGNDLIVVGANFYTADGEEHSSVVFEKASLYLDFYNPDYSKHYDIVDDFIPWWYIRELNGDRYVFGFNYSSDISRKSHALFVLDNDGVLKEKYTISYTENSKGVAFWKTYMTYVTDDRKFILVIDTPSTDDGVICENVMMLVFDLDKALNEGISTNAGEHQFRMVGESLNPTVDTLTDVVGLLVKDQDLILEDGTNPSLDIPKYRVKSY